jgi:hypothetical protein
LIITTLQVSQMRDHVLTNVRKILLPLFFCPGGPSRWRVSEVSSRCIAVVGRGQPVTLSQQS